MFEKKHQPLLPRVAFLARLGRSFGLTLLIVGVSLLFGSVGYHHFGDDLTWVDALLNAAMILTGMGPVGNLTTDGAKMFASAYALFSGVVFISATGILLAPMFHRVLHRFHIEEKDLR